MNLTPLEAARTRLAERGVAPADIDAAAQCLREQFGVTDDDIAEALESVSDHPRAFEPAQ